MSTMVAMAGTEIDELKRVAGVATDQDLAAFLGVERSAIAQWKRRGSVPKKYHFLYKPRSDQDIRAALLSAHRHHIFGHKTHHYWLAAALAVIPMKVFQEVRDSKADVGAFRERTIVRLMGLAIAVTNTDLKKRRCETEADYFALVEALTTTHSEAVTSLIASAIDRE